MTAIAEAFVAVRADTSRIKGDIAAGLSGAEGDAQEAGKRTGGGFASGFKMAAAGLAAVGIADFFKDSIEGAKEAETAQSRLSDAFEKFPSLADTNQKALQDLNTEMAKKVAFDDDSFASGQAVLAQFGLTGNQVREITPLLADYAAKTGVDLPTAAEQLGKGVLGNGRALKSVGIDFKDTGSAAGNLDEIMGGLRSQVGGFAETDAKTAEGQTKMLSLSFGEVKEAVGNALIPVLQRLAEVLLTVVQFIRDNITVMGPLLGVFAALAVAMGVASLATLIWSGLQSIAAVATGLWAAATWALNTALAILTSPITLVIIAIAAIVAGVIYAWNNFETFRNIVTAVWDAIQVVASTVAAWFMNTLWPYLQSVWNNIQGNLAELWGYFTTAWDAIRGAAQAVADWFTNTLVPAFSNAWDAIRTAFDTTVNIIGGIWGRLQELAKTPIRFIINTVINDGLINGINTVAGWLGLGNTIHINPVPLPPGFARGGWTGPGDMYDPAGIVHADEFVVQKKSRRSIENAAPGLLDALNAFGAGALGYAGGGRVRPVPGGYTTYPGHTGVDFPVPTGTSVRAFMDGVVDTVKAMATSYGTYVMMDHGNGLQSIYGHLQQATVALGQSVISGDQIGLSDSTGNSTGPHLHFELRQNGQWFDPSAMLNGTEAIGGGPLSNLKEKVVNFFRDNINGLLDKIPGGGSPFRDVLVGGTKKIVDSVAEFFIGKAAATDSVSAASIVPGKGAAQWSAVALQALQMAGLSDSLLPLLLHRIEVESGGNPNAINNWDSNAKAGHPSQGLMQTIPSTFQAYAGALAGRGITDPLANIFAAIMYTKDRYNGNYGRAWGGTMGYLHGGLVMPSFDRGGVLAPGANMVWNGTGAPEPLVPAGPSVFHLYDSDGVLMGTMRGVADSAVARPANMAAAGRRTV